jgi:hypothetical protein
VIEFQGCSAASQTIASRLLSPKVSRAVLRMLFSRLLRDYSLQGCFATALSLRLLRNGPLSKVALRPLSLGCSATALSYPGLLRDHSLVLGCFATALLSWVASRPLSCPGLLRDRSLVLGCFATALSRVAPRPLFPSFMLRNCAPIYTQSPHKLLLLFLAQLHWRLALKLFTAYRGPYP